MTFNFINSNSNDYDDINRFSINTYKLNNYLLISVCIYITSSDKRSFRYWNRQRTLTPQYSQIYVWYFVRIIDLNSVKTLYQCRQNTSVKGSMSFTVTVSPNTVTVSNQMRYFQVNAVAGSFKVWNWMFEFKRESHVEGKHSTRATQVGEVIVSDIRKKAEWKKEIILCTSNQTRKLAS